MDVFGQLAERHRLRRLEPGQPAADVLDDLRLGRRSRPSCSVTYAAGTSPQRSSGTAITAASSTAGWLGDGLLDLDRGDVLAAGDDHVLAAVAQLDVPVGVQHAEVAGAEPAVRRGLRGVASGVVVVAEHDVVAAQRDLRRPSGRRPARRSPSASITRGGQATMLPTPCRALSRACASASRLVPLRPPVADHRRPERLGQPVQVGDVEAQLAHPAQDRRRRRRAAGGDPHGPVEPARACGAYGQHRQHRRRAARGG